MNPDLRTIARAAAIQAFAKSDDDPADEEAIGSILRDVADAVAIAILQDLLASIPGDLGRQHILEAYEALSGVEGTRRQQEEHDPLCSEGEYRGDQVMDCDCAGLIGQAIPTVEGTEPRLFCAFEAGWDAFEKTRAHRKSADRYDAAFKAEWAAYASQVGCADAAAQDAEPRLRQGPIATHGERPQCREIFGMGGKVYRCALREGHGHSHAHDMVIMWSTPVGSHGNPSLSEAGKQND